MFSFFFKVSQRLVVWPRLDDPFVLQNPKEFSASHFSTTDSRLYIYHLFVRSNCSQWNIFPIQWNIFPIQSCFALNSFWAYLLHSVILWLIIIIIIIPCEFFTLALAYSLSLESEWKQFYSGLPDSSQYSGRFQQCCSMMISARPSISNFTPLSKFSSIVPSAPTTTGTTVTLLPFLFLLPGLLLLLLLLYLVSFSHQR